MANDVDNGGRVFTLGGVFGRTFGVMSGAAKTVFGLSFLFYAIPQAIWGFIAPTFMVGVTPENLGALWTVGGLGGLIMVALNLIVQGALVRAVIAHGEGRATSLSDCIGTGVKMALPLLGMSILAMIGIGVGFVLLIVPGIILAVMWCVAGPALVDEQVGVIGAFGRSRYLTKGARWKIFGLLLLVLVLMWLTLAVIALLAFALGAGGNMGMAQQPGAVMTIVGLIFNTLLIGFWATLFASLFVELRNWKEGLNPGNLEEVFS